MFLRSPGDGIGGETAASFGCEVFRDNHENGLVNFLVGAGAGTGNAAGVCGWGGGAHGTEGSLPESPCRGDLFGGRGGGDIGLSAAGD